MSALPLLARITPPEPLGYGVCLVRRDGRRAVAMGQDSGRLWLLEIDPAAHRIDFLPLPIAIPAERRGDFEPRRLDASAAMDRLLLWDDRPRVYDLPSGGVAAEWDRLPGRASCLSPSGRAVLSLDEGQGWWMDLDAPWRGWQQTWQLHATEREPGAAAEGLYLDHVDELAAIPAAPDEDGAERFHAAAACYGIVETHLVRVGGGALERVPGASRALTRLVYDPTELIRPAGQRYLLVRHGYGAGVSAIDPATGEQHHCRVLPDGRHPYGFFSYPAACTDAPLAWVPTKDGTFLWHIGGALEPRADAHLPLVLTADALLHLDGDDLAWRAIG
ncbi:MAG TPA: hypothetical protein VFQ45_12610 [Longimicrobium sp.]|nr:hypothetical protein [Longimicrobium sp.]